MIQNERTQPPLRSVGSEALELLRLNGGLLEKMVVSAVDRERFWSKVEVRGPDECWPWRRGKFKEGYGAFSLFRKLLKSHRVAYELTFGKMLNGTLGCHHCDNPPCCNPGHIFMGTHGDNIKDMMDKGRAKTGRAHWTKTHPEFIIRGDRHYLRINPNKILRGSQIGTSKMTEIKAREVFRLRLENNMQFKDIAEIMEVNISTIERIVYGITWKHCAP